MTWIEEVDDSLCGKLKPNLNTKSHAQSHKQQVLAPAVFLTPPAISPNISDLFRDIELLHGHHHFQNREQHNDQSLQYSLLWREEGCALWPSITLKHGVHTSIDPVQQTVDIIPRHVPLLVLKKVRTRRYKGQDTNLLAKH